MRFGKAVAFAAAWGAGVYAGFGVPAFIGLLILAMSVGTSERWASDASAYSVFNDGTRIAGTLSADQLDEQMRNGGHAKQRAHAAPESSFLQNALRGWGGGVESARARNKPSGGAVDEAELRRRRSAAADAAQARARAQPQVGPDIR